jgi:HNH endonuclease
MSEMGRKIGRWRTSARERLKVLGIEVPEEVSKKFFKNNVFKKGHPNPNKGKKQEEFCSPEQIENLKKVRFQKGQKSYRAKKDLQIVLRMSINGKLQYWIRLGPCKWQQYSHYLWLKSGKEIPTGYVIAFKNNNPLKCTLNNLECITRNELLKRNKVNTWTNKRKEKPLNVRRHAHYISVKPALKKQREKIAKLNIKGKSTDEINWNKKYLSPKEIKIKDTSGLIPFRVNQKTIILIKPGADTEKIKEQYSSLNKTA